MVRPLAGLMMGMAFRVRVAAGWWSFNVACCVWWKVGGTKAGEVELRENEATCWGCCVGEALGELLDNEDRSDEELLIDTSYRWRQVSYDSSTPRSCGERRSHVQQRPHATFRSVNRSDKLTSLSVNNLGQNSMSSSRSNERLHSNWDRKLDTDTDSDNSFMLLTPRNCRCEFWETDSLGALRFRPPWWL